ncbi:MAG TPA: kelch repeat-containing protein [Chitinophagaceae bacterium]|jgi:N-acetylneuraminic acid mutarotase
MRKVTSYLFLAGSALFLLYACTKSGSSTTIIGNWVNRFDFDGISRTEAVSFTILDTAFVGTGYAGAGNATLTNDRLPDFWKFNVTTNSWTQIASLPDTAARSSAVGFGTSTKGYVTTGLAQDGITKMKDTWEYTPGGGWVKRADFAGTARYDAVGFSLLEKGYVATGYDNNYLKDFYVFDPVANTWTLLQSFQGFKRKGAVAFTYNNKAYICTGQDNTTYPNDFWVYNPSGSTWTQLRQIANISTDNYDDNYNIIRANAVSFVMNGKGYVCTGENGSLFKSVWEYDFPSDLWIQKSDFEGGTRTGAVGFAVKQRGYLLTGNVSSQVFSDFWEFHPEEEYNQYD